MTEYVTVRISGVERVRYDQIKKIPKAGFESLKARLDSNDRSESRKTGELIGALFIDRRDVFDADIFEVDDFMIVESSE